MIGSGDPCTARRGSPHAAGGHGFCFPPLVAPPLGFFSRWLAVVWIVGCLFAQAACAEPTLASRLDALLSRRELRGARVGVRVVALPGGAELYARGADEPLAPASNMKLVTMAAALGVLGEDHRYRTVVAVSGPDLVVIGSGDPSLGATYSAYPGEEVFRRWAGHLWERGVRVVQGDLVLDDSRFDREWVHPAWPRNQLHRAYEAPVGALSVAGNCVEISVRPASQVGGAAEVAISPVRSGLSLEGTVRTTGSRKQHLWSVYRPVGSREVQVRGRFYRHAGEQSGRVTVEDPTRFFGSVLAEVLRAEGIELRGRVRTGRARGDAPLRPQLIQETRLAELLPLLGKESDNHAAEHVFKTIGAERRGGPGSWETGRDAVLEYLRSVGLSIAAVRIDDGSGLSKDNEVTARFVTELLRYMFAAPQGRLYRESLAVAGMDGTLRRRLRKEPYRGRVWAKTGTLAGVRALSGYVQTHQGRWLAFSFLVNDCRYGVRGLQDEFCRVLVGSDE